jgi:LPS export ABC transporter protein LptC
MTNKRTSWVYTWAALLWGCFFVCSCENNIKQVQALGKKTPGVEEGINIESYLSQAGRMSAKLTAPRMLRYLLDTPRVEFTNRMHVDFYDSATTVESQLNCKYGRYFENQNQVYLRDSVVVFNRTFDTLWTDELNWDQNKGEFYTDKRVKIKREGNANYIHGFGMRSDQAFRYITIYNIQPDSYMNIPDSTGPR